MLTSFVGLDGFAGIMVPVASWLCIFAFLSTSSVWDIRLWMAKNKDLRTNRAQYPRHKKIVAAYYDHQNCNMATIELVFKGYYVYTDV